MYIIENGNAYIIKGDKVYKIDFALDKHMIISDEEEDIDVKGKQKYTYDEIFRKLNVEYMVAKALEEKELKEKIESLMESGEPETQEESEEPETQEESEETKTTKKNKENKKEK